MQIAIGCMVVLCVILAVLCAFRFGDRTAGARAGKTRYETGRAMTIGARQVQEDNYAIAERPAGLAAVLADGMGRAYGGRIASRIAVECFSETFQNDAAYRNPHYYLRRAFHESNRVILNTLDGRKGAACVSSVIIQGQKAYYALVGNIEVAVFRNGDLIRVSEGHTIDQLAQMKFKEGVLSRKDAQRLLHYHRLYNYVGQDGFRDIEFFDTPLVLHPGDIVIMMSDGVTQALSWKEIEDELAQNVSAQDMAQLIIQRIESTALEDQDNASVVLLRML